MADPARPRTIPGLRALSALLFGAVLVGGGALVWLLHAPWLRGRLEEDTGRLVTDSMAEVAAARREDLDRTGEVLRSGTDHLVERWRRDLEDLPFELVAGDPAAVRSLVARETEAVGAAARENARVLSSEVRRRSEERMARLEASLGEMRERAGRDTAASLAVSSSLVILGLLAALLGLQGFLLGRLISEGADRLAAVDLSFRIEEGGSREVAELGAALNRMAASVERSSSEVRALNEGLGRRVAEKSAALVRAETLASLGTLAGGVAHEFNNLLGGILGTAEDAKQDARDESTREALELPPFPADPAGLHQVVLNLLTNALAFTPPGGRIEAVARRDGDRAVLRVRDTGPGIPPAALPRIFEPFFTTRGSEGTGLGLAVSHGIVRAHGGTIEAADDPAGGAAFTVRLPLAPAKGGAS